ncbi:alpha/beta hydrolase family protein [Pseudoalteromonas rubra]|uniref:alpha/beta hydrolase family protein n=1 Tax=Pseudoalteromonas rubra TaxID=43658 RepID=UPI000F7901F8|nr:prolyl oligopeptidase family serine peptidase [Pseudoalteromonas rubra]
MKLKSVAVLLLSALSTSLSAAPINKQDIQFIGPLGQASTIKPYNTAHQQTIIANLVPSLSGSEKTVSMLGVDAKWQPLSQLNALTMGGLQAMKMEFSVNRFVQGELVLDGIEKAHIFVNGERHSDKMSSTLNLPTGDHQVIIVAEQVADWKKVSVAFNGKTDHDQLLFTDKTTKALSAKQLFDAPVVSAVSVSPDAEHYVTTQKHYQANRGNQALTQTTVFNDDDKVIFTLEGVNASSLAWRQDGEQLVYSQHGQLKTLDLTTLTSRVIAEDLKGASEFAYFNDTSLIFSWSKSPAKDTSLVKHYQGLEDRWSYTRTNTQIYLLDIKTGMIQALTEGKQSHTLEDHDAKSNRILTSRAVQDYAAPPHMLTELVEFNLTQGTETVLGQYRTFNEAKYGAKGIYAVAGPDFKNGLGRAVEKDQLTNNYDGQLYWLDQQGAQAKALSKAFNPAIGSINVLSNGDVIAKVTDEDRQQLYLYDVSKDRYTRLKTGLDVVERFSIADNRKPALLVAGTQASAPQQLKQVNIYKNRARTLWDSAPLAYSNSEIAKLEEFNFTNSQGTEIKGRVYLPHNLDKSKQYPALIYYYGGTSPVSRAFTGRYPFNLWAANGYVVYVLQPTGATGFGQRFSAQHVNAWGEQTADDIIKGTKAFLTEYPYVDKNRLGNLGASYGGFMTMLLTTKTDMFSASISHAGISNITSYWGQGWWGYLYSGEASKHSFPWNNAKLYSQHSPVFNADKVTTPLLLLHGDADVNVPVGESHTMYTALKLLGQDVELIEIKGADHQIFARDRRFQWWDTMLAYFDKHLKDQPQWWQHLYGK